MKKYEIVKEHKEFDDVLKNGSCKKCIYVYIYNKDNKLNISRFGIAVGKKNGNAVLRNKMKRRYRMILNNNKNLFKKGKDYIIIVKRSAVDASYEQLNNDIVKSMTE